jgi:hypothetical protein
LHYTGTYGGVERCWATAEQISSAYFRIHAVVLSRETHAWPAVHTASADAAIDDINNALALPQQRTSADPVRPDCASESPWFWPVTAAYAALPKMSATTSGSTRLQLKRAAREELATSLRLIAALDWPDGMPRADPTKLLHVPSIQKLMYDRRDSSAAVYQVGSRLWLGKGASTARDSPTDEGGDGDGFEEDNDEDNADQADDNGDEHDDGLDGGVAMAPLAEPDSELRRLRLEARNREAVMQREPRLVVPTSSSSDATASRTSPTVDTPTPTLIAIDVENDPDGDAAADGIYVFEDERTDSYHPYSVVNDRLKPDCPQQGHGRDGLQCRTAIYHCDPDTDDGYGLSVLKFGAGFQFSGAPTMLSCCSCCSSEYISLYRGCLANPPRCLCVSIVHLRVALCRTAL